MTVPRQDPTRRSSAGASEASGHRSGFVVVVGRPNVGKSTLVNRMVGQKVSIVSARPSTTRRRLRGIVRRPGLEIVLIDTPGIHRPRGRLGPVLNQQAYDAIEEGVDAVVQVVDGAAGIGAGDRFLRGRVPPDTLTVVNKIDAVRPRDRAACLRAAEELGGAVMAVSARTGLGVEGLVRHLAEQLPEGPPLYPAEAVSELTLAEWVAELVREQLLAVVEEELPHGLACKVTEWEWPRVRCEIRVERPSQRAIVVGRGGSVLKQVGSAVRAALPPGCYLELFVKVARDWQRRADALDLVSEELTAGEEPLGSAGSPVPWAAVGRAVARGSKAARESATPEAFSSSE
jgi:GTP-binding protein Era